MHSLVMAILSSDGYASAGRLEASENMSAHDDGKAFWQSEFPVHTRDDDDDDDDDHVLYHAQN
jgi:hypothetical protein